nr:MAG TPA: hypothetical protein [Caudoviricetes sp.]DAM82829.1 MAG TPA: hypothetical protein [Caudoviricetes sp.]
MHDNPVESEASSDVVPVIVSLYTVSFFKLPFK